MDKLIARVKGVILSPKAEWEVIEAEQADPQKIAINYVAPLLAIGVAASAIGGLVFGYGGFGVTFRPSIGSTLSTAVLSFVLGLGGVFLVAFIVNLLAPTFGATKNFSQAFKVTAYSGTPAWLAQVVTILPSLGALSLIGALYALYLFFVGLPMLMKPAAEKATNYALASIAAVVGISLVAGLLILPLAASRTGMFAAGGPAFNAALGGGSVAVGGGSSAGRSGDGGSFEQRMNDAAEQMEQAGAAGDVGGVLGALGGALGASDGPIVKIDALRALAPERLLGMSRTSLETQSMGAPLKVATLEARYEGGDRSVELEIANSPAIMMFGGFAGAMAPEYDRQTDDGYERMRRVGQNFVVEEWSKSSKTGKFTRFIGGTFMVSASGRGVDMDDLKKAVDVFSEADLKRLPTAE